MGKLDIGFKTVTFSYDSHVQYVDFHTIISTSKGGNVFDELYSKWNIQEHSFNKCMVNYEVKMTFSNPLYASVTRYFFDTLVVNATDSFIKACNMSYENQMEEALEKSK